MPSQSTSHPAAGSLAAIVALRECIGSYTTQPDLSRVLIAQCNHAEQLLNAGLYDDARESLVTIQKGMLAAGPFAWGAGL